MTVQRGQGDPEGRRTARRRNLLLAEAGRVGRALAALLRRADYDASDLDGLLRAIGRKEAEELMRSLGPLESRKRFKYQSGQPLHEERIPDNLFLDESGRPDPRSPGLFFALGGVAMAESEVASYKSRADALKLRFFGRDDITFHEPDIRTHRDWFSLGGDADRQQAFCSALDELVAGTELALFAVAIRKDEFAEFVALDDDPYLPA